jgi:hypothetical protein
MAVTCGYGHRGRFGAAAKAMRPEAVQGRRAERTRDIGAATKRGLWAMHAEPEEIAGQASSKAPIVTGNVPISASAALISADTKESGLWVWQGEVPPSRSFWRRKSSALQTLRRIMPAARRVGWIALPTGLALVFITILMKPHPDRLVSADTPAVALSSAPLPTVARPIVAVPPAELTEAQMDQVRVPSAPATKITAHGLEPPVAKGGAQRKLSRTARKTHASHVRRGPLFPPGALTPPRGSPSP